MTITSNGKEITLNESQVGFLEAYKVWRKDKDKLFFCLSGSAGTGKSTVAKCAIEEEYSVVVTAPTHKAKKIISKMTGRVGQTIHKIIGLRPNTKLEEFTHKNLAFSLSEDGCTMQDFNIVVIDESSMVNAELIKFIKEKAKEFKTKILFMGDENQLPPVKEKLGLVFVDSEIEHYRLTKVERQSSNNPLMFLYDRILSNIKSKDDLYEKDTNMYGDLGYSFISDSQKFTDIITSKFTLGEYSDNKVLAWTNDRVRKWNNLIRRQMVGIDGSKSQLIIGEFLIADKTVKHPSRPKSIIIENSCEYKVLRITSTSKKSSYYCVKDKMDKYLTIRGSDVTIENIDNNITETLFIVHPSSYQDFSIIDIVKSEFAKKAKPGSERGYRWKMYYDFRENFFLFGNILDENGNKMCEKDLDYSYAITVHKSQGSTYENVFVDESNLDEFWDKKMTDEEICATRNRLKYVAFSRPSKAAFIYYKK